MYVQIDHLVRRQGQRQVVQHHQLRDRRQVVHLVQLRDRRQVVHLVQLRDQRQVVHLVQQRDQRQVAHLAQLRDQFLHQGEALVRPAVVVVMRDAMRLEIEQELEETKQKL
jgi:hypothetical protein